MTLENIRKHPWFFPVVSSLIFHFLLVLALWFIHVKTNPLAEEHVTRKFRLKGVDSIPTITGKPGGGDRFGSTTALKFTNKDKANPAQAVKDVSVQSLVSRSTPLNQNTMKIEPRKIEMEGSSLINTRDFRIRTAF